MFDNAHLIARYESLNNSYTPRLIFHLTYRGFCSELNNMVLAILFCLTYKIQFRLFSKHWVSSHTGAGWTDYFLPFCPQERSWIHTRKTVFPGKKEYLGRGYDQWLPYLNKVFTPGYLYSPQVWRAVRGLRARKHFHIPELGIEGDLYHAMKALLCGLVQLNPAWRAYMQPGHPALAGYEYTALHVRRGDKTYGAKKEAEAIDIDRYMAAARAYAPDTDRLFLATDDYRVVQDLGERYPHYTVVSYCDRNRLGYCERAFYETERAQRKTEVQNFLLDLYHLASARVFIGTFSSNVSRTVALLRKGNTLGVDGRWTV